MKKQHAMKKILVIAILGLAGLGWSAQEASAGPLLNCLCCCKKCRVKLYAKQYNAFSPYCLDSLSGCLPLGGFNGGGPGFGGCGPACFSGNGGYAMGELPAQSPEGFAGQMMMGDGQMGQNWQAWGPGMVNPNGMPTYYPTSTGAAPFPGAGR
jgi:hypothetical protein